MAAQKWCFLLFMSLNLRLGHAQNFGPGFCLLTCLGVFPCDKVYDTTPDPGDNQYSIYNTGFIQGSAGLPVCVLGEPSPTFSPIRRIDSIGLRSQVKILISPNNPDTMKYESQLLVTYNVSCPEYHLAHFNLLDINLPPAGCTDGIGTNGACRCFDYIIVDAGIFGSHEICGSNTQFNLLLHSNNAVVQFRTSLTVSGQYRGFKMMVTCLSQDEEPPADCIQSSNMTVEIENLLHHINQSGFLSEQVINMARTLQHSCHAVLRTVSIAILENANRSQNALTCRDGFYGNGSFCLDNDECQSGENDCSRSAHCTNTPGSFNCTCEEGYIGDGLTCLAPDSFNFTCNSSDSNCFCFDGRCGCLDGFDVAQDDNDAVICKDIDECLENPCENDSVTVCLNTEGSYLCTCTNGYVFNLINGTCDDFDECQFNTSDCDKNALCENVPGSFDCTCLAGFIGDGKNCYKQDSHCKDVLNCQQHCIDFECVCTHGYVLSLDKRSCQDINECALSYDICDENASCSNTNGSFLCICNSGFYGNGRTCIDMDECQSGLHSCDVNAACVNNIGSYLCLCRSPYSGDGFTCSRGPVVHRFNDRPGRPNHELQYPAGVDFCLEESTEGYRFTVICSLQSTVNPSANFTFNVTQHTQGENIPLNGITHILSVDSQSITVTTTQSLPHLGYINITCSVSNINGNDNITTTVTLCDPNACQDGVTNNCTRFCRRNYSGNQTLHECYCEEGYIWQDGQCTDKDECSEIPPVCSNPNTVCVNIEGTYFCPCKKGYDRTIDNECQDIDECSVEMFEDTCEEICVNTNGSYTCNCYDGFEINKGDNRSCININECDTGAHNCLLSEDMECIDTVGSFMCICEAGYVMINKDCEDIDECVEDLLNNCSYMCVNTNGSYECVCQLGFTLQDDNSTCSVLTVVVVGGAVGALVFVSILVILVLLCCKYLTSHWNQLKKCCVPKKSAAKVDINFFEDEVKGLSVQSSYKLSLPPHLIIHSETLELRETVGEGEFGIVYKGYIVRKRGSIMKEPVAIKTLKGFYNQAMVREMLQECKRMFSLSHPNVLCLTGVCLDGGPTPYIIMPFMTNGSLLSYLKKHRDDLVISPTNKLQAESVLKRLNDMCIQVAKGMEYLTLKGIVHRDLAARNCMISVNFVIKVADFGLSVNVGTKHYYRQDKDCSLKLPLRWLAPESIHDFVFSEKSDVWAYGVTCWEIFSGGMLPYAGISVADLPYEIQAGKVLDKPLNEACNDKMYQIMKDCWKLKAEERPTFSELIERLSTDLESMASYLKLLEEDVKHEPAGDKDIPIQVDSDMHTGPASIPATSAINETSM